MHPYINTYHLNIDCQSHSSKHAKFIRSTVLVSKNIAPRRQSNMSTRLVSQHRPPSQQLTILTMPASQRRSLGTLLGTLLTTVATLLLAASLATHNRLMPRRYAPATIIEAKRLVLDVRTAGMPLEVAREGLRSSLLHALRYGHTLVVRLTNSAANFLGCYCAPDTFPLCVFEQPKWPNNATIALTPDSAKTTSGNGADSTPSAAVLFGRILRAADVADSGGKLDVGKDFRVVVTSAFSPESYERLLGGSLPLQHLQPIHIVDREPTVATKAYLGSEVTPSSTAEQWRQPKSAPRPES